MVLAFMQVLFVLVPEPLNASARQESDSADLAVLPPGYHTYEEIIALTDSLAVNFPAICKKEVFGTSLGGRELAALKISDNPDSDEPEPKILFDAGCHGNEIGGPENLIRFARDLCLKYGTDTLVTGLINTREIWIYLMVNPDGRVNMSRFNEAMVDLNRDYGYMWNASGGSTEAFSQPETRGVRSCLDDCGSSVYVSYHSGLEQAAYPWAYREDEPRDKPHLRRLAKTYSDSSLYLSLDYGQSYIIMYQANGMSIDYAYGSLGTACLTIEISVDKLPPDPLTYYIMNYPSMIEMIRLAGWGLEGSVTDSLTGEPVDAAIWVDNFFPSYTLPATGYFNKYLLPGTHTLKITANGYATRTGISCYVPQQGSSVVNIPLMPDSVWTAHKVLACHIPGDNPADEGFSPGALLLPDSIAYSLGKGGWVILDLGDTIHPSDGNELAVFEAGDSDEGYSCYAGVSPDGPWSNLGTGYGTTSFDIGMEPDVRYLKILDDGDGNGMVPDAGFDLDAVKVRCPVYTPVPEPADRISCVVYPNPSSGLYAILFPPSGNAKLDVYDATGRSVLKMSGCTGEFHIDLSSSPDGFYYGYIVREGTKLPFKLIKLH